MRLSRLAQPRSRTLTRSRHPRTKPLCAQNRQDLRIHSFNGAADRVIAASLALRSYSKLIDSGYHQLLMHVEPGLGHCDSSDAENSFFTAALQHWGFDQECETGGSGAGGGVGVGVGGGEGGKDDGGAANDEGDGQRGCEDAAVSEALERLCSLQLGGGPDGGREGRWEEPLAH